MRTGAGRLEQMRRVLFWPWACWSACVLLLTPQRCVTPNRDMSSSVTAKARPRASSFRRPGTTTPPATTIHPNLAAPDLRRPQRIRCSAPWFCAELRRSARSLNLGTTCADTTLLGNLRDPVPKPTPPSDHIPLRRRCAFWCRPVSTRQWPNLVFAVA
jgi:hypothetical protein